jgi:hypothetical protein
MARKIMSALERWFAAYHAARRDRIERIIRTGFRSID